MLRGGPGCEHDCGAPPASAQTQAAHASAVWLRSAPRCRMTCFQVARPHARGRARRLFLCLQACGAQTRRAAWRRSQSSWPLSWQTCASSATRLDHTAAGQQRRQGAQLSLPSSPSRFGLVLHAVFRHYVTPTVCVPGTHTGSLPCRQAAARSSWLRTARHWRVHCPDTLPRLPPRSRRLTAGHTHLLVLQLLRRQ